MSASATVVVMAHDNLGPQITFVQPVANKTNNAIVTIEVTTTESSTCVVDFQSSSPINLHTTDGVIHSVNSVDLLACFNAMDSLCPITVICDDELGNQATVTKTIYFDDRPPRIQSVDLITTEGPCNENCEINYWLNYSTDIARLQVSTVDHRGVSENTICKLIGGRNYGGSANDAIGSYSSMIILSDSYTSIHSRTEYALYDIAK